MALLTLERVTQRFGGLVAVPLAPAEWVAPQHGPDQPGCPGSIHQMPPTCSRSRPAALIRSTESRCTRSAAAPGAVMR